MDHRDRCLNGPFAPVKEEVTAYDLPVTGRLPAGLNGRYLRLGPNPLGVEDPVTHFWAFGAGMVHGVRIRDGRAERYRNRWVRSTEVSDALDRMKRGLQPPAFLPPSPNIHVLRRAGRALALSEVGGLPHELGYELDTIGELPLTSSMDAMSFRWDPAHQAHVGVLPRTGGQVRWFPVESFYLSHVLDAYDDGSTITVDLIAAEGPVDVADPGGTKPRFDRWSIDLRARLLEQRCVDDRAQDFPRVNDAYASRPHRYGYSTATPVHGMQFTPRARTPTTRSPTHRSSTTWCGARRRCTGSRGTPPSVRLPSPQTRAATRRRARRTPVT
ncbi:carotenoid oxygenase family protein [Streptomyces griseomycini]|uniref:carotenoid oxygenase family protein n=1 Tax=Streptomyces griseomycini TaxID=66895 RepID=UPI00341486D1